MANNTNAAKYIMGYAQEDTIDLLAAELNMSSDQYKQIYGLNNIQYDEYDPNNTSNSKNELFWGSNDNINIHDGKTIQKSFDDVTDTFKRAIRSNDQLGGTSKTDFWYEDPFFPAFELLFDDSSPLFNNNATLKNSLNYFMNTYNSVDINYTDRIVIWNEFKNTFFKVFASVSNSDIKTKAYYITKIGGLNHLNKKMINYGAADSKDADKITITMNEDVSMLAWYIAELYNNLTYSYKNQRHMFPENLIRFDLTIKINDIRNFQLPKNINQSSPNVPNNMENTNNKQIQYEISPKSQIVYTLHDCNFNFFESKNYGEDMEIGGYGGGITYTPQSLTFDIYFKSVTRYSNFPLISNLGISPWGETLQSVPTQSNIGTLQNLYDNVNVSKSIPPNQKSYTNNNRASTISSTDSLRDAPLNTTSQSSNFLPASEFIGNPLPGYEDTSNSNSQNSQQSNLIGNPLPGYEDAAILNPDTQNPQLDMIDDKKWTERGDQIDFNMPYVYDPSLNNPNLNPLISRKFGAGFLNDIENAINGGIRGLVINNLLSQFRTLVNINKIEPDNVYAPDFNNFNVFHPDYSNLGTFNLHSVGDQIASDLLNNLEIGVSNTSII